MRTSHSPLPLDDGRPSRLPSSKLRLVYQHGFHAGCFQDVMKHSVLVLLLARMCEKPSPFTYVETHAGAGRYDLEAALPQEISGGIKLLQSDYCTTVPPEASTLLGLLDHFAEGSMRYYPGSPLVAVSQCRPQDTVVLCEFAADQHELLTSVMTEVAQIHRNLPTIKIHLADGYKALQQKRGVATPERRGLVFVDPPYSYGSDTQRAVALAVHLRVNWRSARFCLWYPATRAHSKVVDSFRGASLGACLAAELFRGGEDGKGTGMLLVQPPFGIEAELRELLNGLARSLRREGEESLEVRVRWVSSEE